MKHTFSINQLILAIVSLGFATFLFSYMQPTEPKIRLSEDDLLILTEMAFLQGYKAALLKEHQDTVWSSLSNEYREIFK